LLHLPIDWNNIKNVLLSLLQICMFQRYANSAISLCATSYNGGQTKNTRDQMTSK